MNTENQTPDWLSQVQRFNTGADLGQADVVTEHAAVAAALGAIAEGLLPADGGAHPALEGVRPYFEKWLHDAGMSSGIRRDGDSYCSREIHNLWLCWRHALVFRIAGIPPIEGLVDTTAGAALEADITSSGAELSLGEQLRINSSNEGLRKARAEAEKRDQRIREEDANNVLVAEFFNKSWALFARNIANGLPAGTVLVESFGQNSRIADLLSTYNWHLPGSKRWQDGGTGIWNATRSKYERQWREFLAGCENDGLTPVWTYDHDGVGMRSWWLLTVAPKA